MACPKKIKYSLSPSISDFILGIKIESRNLDPAYRDPWGLAHPSLSSRTFSVAKISLVHCVSGTPYSPNTSTCFCLRTFALAVLCNFFPLIRAGYLAFPSQLQCHLREDFHRHTVTTLPVSLLVNKVSCWFKLNTGLNWWNFVSQVIIIKIIIWCNVIVVIIVVIIFIIRSRSGDWTQAGSCTCWSSALLLSCILSH